MSCYTNLSISIRYHTHIHDVRQFHVGWIQLIDNEFPAARTHTLKVQRQLDYVSTALMLRPDVNSTLLFNLKHTNRQTI